MVNGVAFYGEAMAADSNDLVFAPPTTTRLRVIDIKRGFDRFDIPSAVHANAVSGMLDAIEAKFGIPVIYTSTVRDLATERAASWLSKHFTYWWLEQHGLGRVLIDSDRL